MRNPMFLYNIAKWEFQITVLWLALLLNIASLAEIAQQRISHKRLKIYRPSINNGPNLIAKHIYAAVAAILATWFLLLLEAQ